MEWLWIMENTSKQQNFQINIEGIKQLSIMYNDLGILNYQKKSYKKALSCFEEAMKYFDILYKNIDKTVSSNQDFIKLIQQQIFETKISILDISKKLGDEKFEGNDFFGALEYYKNIIPCSLDEALCIRVSDCLLELGAYISAVSFLTIAAELNPQNAKHYRAIGDIYNEKMDNYESAVAFYEKYVENEKEDKVGLSEVYCGLGHLYEKFGKYETVEKQIECFQKAIELDPSFVGAYRNLTVAYPRVKKNQEAIDCFKKIFELGATMDDFFDYACLNIKLKNFKEGWKYYEYRFSKEKSATPYPKMPKPKWKGEDISDKTLLVQCEQGFGDSIQFFRYIPQLKSKASKVIYRAPDELVDLLQKNADGFEIVKNSTPIEKIAFDCHIPLMSLPKVLEATVENIPMTQKYISADPSKIEEYKNNFFNNDCIKIGISWHGAAVGNQDRNIPFETFLPLARLKNVKLYSFQKNITVEELDKLPLDVEVIKLGRTFKDFSDTAAAMANLDLFISADNGVFNLAGAMGVKTFLLLNSNAEWRWFLDDEINPWYENVKIFRKENDLDSWDLLMHKVIPQISG